MEEIKITISAKLYERLQAIAVPLIDNEESLIEKLIDYWETQPPNQTTLPEEPLPQTWRTRDGDVLVVGETLKAKYLRRQFEARVEMNAIVFDGNHYRSLSAAGRAVKKKTGKTGTTRITNGRQFWKGKNSIGQFVKVIERLAGSARHY